MAIPSGSGTEVLKVSMFRSVDTTEHKLVDGVANHIYTILSVSCYCNARNSTENGFLRIMGYDSYAGETNQQILISSMSVAAGETFVWNDKFSFNGYEPVDFSGIMSTIAEQDAIADQGNTGTNPTGAQYLSFFTGGASTTYDVTCTFIDQSNVQEKP